MPKIKIASLDGSEFGAYCAMPVGDHGPGLIVIQEIFGVNAYIRALCDDYAARGYIALSPDLFWRQQKDVQLSDRSAADVARANELFKTFDVEQGVRDLLSTLGHVRKMPGCNGKVGVIGHGLGGRLAFLMATRSDADATVGFYGANIDKNIDEVHDIRLPLMLHFAGDDEFTPKLVRERIIRNLARNPVITAHVYEGAGHAFALEGGPNYNKDAAALADRRSKEFLAFNLIS